MTQSSKAADTTTAKREVREALKFAGFAAKVQANATHIQVTVADEANVADVLRMYPDAVAPYANDSVASFRRVVSIPR
jgi:hypothetical protein